jgi:hypothetical protein
LDAISAYNAKAREKYNVQLDVMPEPFIGIETAPVVLLNLNPGFDEQDPKVHACSEFQSLLRDNNSQRSSPFPFYFLNPAVESSGRLWWEKRLHWLIKEFGTKELARSLLCVEYFPYHSRRFGWVNPVLPSQDYGFGLVCSAIARRSVIVIMRAERRWKEKILELEGYRRVFRLNSPQNVVVSPNNCAGFNVIVRAIRDGLAHA